MKTKELIDAWRISEVPESFGAPGVNQELLTKVHGGAQSAGNVCSLSAECNKSGDSCAEYWTKFKQAAQAAWMGFYLHY